MLVPAKSQGDSHCWTSQTVARFVLISKQGWHAFGKRLSGCLHSSSWAKSRFAFSHPDPLISEH